MLLVERVTMLPVAEYVVLPNAFSLTEVSLFVYLRSYLQQLEVVHWSKQPGLVRWARQKKQASSESAVMLECCHTHVQP